jgi:hypothetical protein
MWCLWKSRCSYVYEGKRLCPVAVVRMAWEYSQTGLSLPRKNVHNSVQSLFQVDSNEFNCTIDGSYAEINGVGHWGGCDGIKEG